MGQVPSPLSTWNRFELWLSEVISKIEHLTTTKFFQYRGTRYGIVVLFTYSLFSVAKFDFYYDLFLIIELIISIYFGYLILRQDCEAIYKYYKQNNNAYTGQGACKDINKTLDEKDKTECYKYKALFAIFVFVLFTEYIFFLLFDSNYDFIMLDGSLLHNFLSYSYHSIINGLKHNYDFLHKILHLLTALSIMVFATCIISNLSTQRLLNLIDIIKKETI